MKISGSVVVLLVVSMMAAGAVFVLRKKREEENRYGNPYAMPVGGGQDAQNQDGRGLSDMRGMTLKDSLDRHPARG